MSDDLIKRPPDEEFDTQMEVERNPCGAWMAIQSQAERIEQLEEKVEQWKAGFALADAKWGKVLIERDKAVEALRELVTCVEDGCYCSEAKMAGAMDDAHAVLAELEDGK